jgi:uncharacterized protein (TIGR02117 family)
MQNFLNLEKLVDHFKRSWMKKALMIIFYPVLFLIGALILYLVAAVLAMLVPINPPKISEETDIEIFVQTNGLHADFILPSKNSVYDWEALLPLEMETPAKINHIAIGWGEKNFYLNTPTMSDLTFPTLVKALFVPSEAAMHVEHRRYRPPSNDDARSIWISEEMYRTLVEYILEYFVIENGQPKIFPGKGYHEYDAFYAAHGKYHMFWTCNNWTNAGLKKIGIKNSLWTPMDWGVFFYLD